MATSAGHGTTSTGVPTPWPVAWSAAGVAPGDRVALLVRPSAPAIAAIHGLARVGAVAAPLGVGLTPGELATAIADVDPRLVLAGAGLAEVARRLGRSGPRHRRPRRGRGTCGRDLAARPRGAGGRDPHVRHDRAPEGGPSVQRGPHGERRGVAHGAPSGDGLAAGDGSRPRRRARGRLARRPDRRPAGGPAAPGSGRHRRRPRERTGPEPRVGRADDPGPDPGRRRG